MNDVALYTLGHSNREPEAFAQLLIDRGIVHLLDIRSFPQSRRFPHFNAGNLRELVESLGITYHLTGRQFGGRRENRIDSPHTALEEGLRGFADYMATEEFAKAVDQLVRLAGRQGPLAIMCAERLPENCHRRLLADYLHLKGVEVRHLVDSARAWPHALSPELREVRGQLIYDRHANVELEFH